jgi:glutathione peroxidase
MKKLLSSIFFMLILNSLNAQQDIYSFRLDSVSGKKKIDLSSYKGRAILIVNTATNGSQVYQLAQLQQLFQSFRDSGLVVISIPSNDFNNEPGSNESIGFILKNTYEISFPVAARSSVSGRSVNQLYRWLTSRYHNKVMDAPVRGDFQKFLINKEGKLAGVFSGKLAATSALLINAIRNIQ